MSTGVPPKKKRTQEPEMEVETEGGDEDIEPENDPKGEEKVDLDGVLLGNRQYAIRTCVLPRHPTRHYMLTMDVSKALGYRDSYIFFSRNPQFPRINATEEDKEWLIERGWVPTQLRSRNVAILTARSVFRTFGHRVIHRGRPVRDDYFVGEKSEADMLEMEDEGEESASMWDDHRKSMYYGRGRALPQFSVDLNAPELLGPSMSKDLPLYRVAAAAAEFNSRLRAQRKTSFFEMHTNMDLVPGNTQPTSYSVLVNPETLSQVPVHVDIDDVVEALKEKDASLDAKFVSIAVPEEDLKYPLAIIPGQHQASVSLYRKRFGPEDVKEMPKDVIVPDVEQPEEVAPEPEDTNQLPVTMDLNVFVCGEITKLTGTECRRNVLTPGDKCLHHDPYRLGPCIHCQKVEAPVKKSQKTEYPIPDKLMLACANCKERSHPICIQMESPVVIAKCQRYPWHCSNCKVCLTCNEAGDEAKLLFCDACDRGYHTYCLKPALDKLPDGSWLCSLCAVCKSCGKKGSGGETKSRRSGVGAGNSSSKFAHAIAPAEHPNVLATYLCTYCTKCYDMFEKERFCPICMKTYEEDSDVEMICCDSCDRWVHVGCDPELTDEMYQKMMEDPKAKFKCALCDDRKLGLMFNSKKSASDLPFSCNAIRYKSKKLITPPLLNY